MLLSVVGLGGAFFMFLPWKTGSTPSTRRSRQTMASSRNMFNRAPSLLPWSALIAVLISSAGASACRAQTVQNAALSAVQPTVSRDDAGFSSCGVRAVIVVGEGKANRAYDFSINAYAEAVSGMIKAGAYSDLKATTAAIHPAPVGFWIAEATKGAALRPKKIMPAESPGFILGLTELVPAVEVMYALALGTRMQFSLRYKGEAVDRAVSFEKRMGKTDFEAFTACMDGLQKRMERAANAATEDNSAKSAHNK